MKERTKIILEYVIKDFIESGKPVSSFSLVKKYDFKIKSAMIRWELKALTDEGYLYKCHSSGGRIPTDKAYHYFVNKILAENFQEEAIKIKKIDLEKMLDEIVRKLKVLALLYHLNYQKLYHAGLRYLIDYFDLKNDLKTIFTELDYLPQRINAYLINLNEKETDYWPKIFIGKNDFVKNDNLALIVEKLEDQSNNQFFLFLVGPKRMNYIKSINYFKKLCQK